MLLDDARKNILAEIVAGLGVLGIGDEDRDHEVSVEYIDAHGAVDSVRVQAGAFGHSRLLFEADDAPVLVGFDDAEAAGGLFR